jgi:hypothetical protein
MIVTPFNIQRTVTHVVLLATLLCCALTQAASKQSLSYVSWKDPIEGAFTTVAPAGWKVTGGMYRFAPVDVRVQMNAGSPDGAMHVQVGDAVLTTFAVPGPSSQIRGLHEGQYYEVNGVRYTVLHAMSGTEFSRFYVQSKLAKALTALKIGESRDRPDIAQALGQPLQDGASLGETEFTFTRAGRAMRGACYVRVEPGMGGIFRANPSVVLAPADEMKTAAEVLMHMVSHLRLDPQWQARMTRTAKEFADRVLRNHDAAMAELQAEYKKCISRINATAALWHPVLNPPGR